MLTVSTFMHIHKSVSYKIGMELIARPFQRRNYANSYVQIVGDTLSLSLAQLAV